MEYFKVDDLITPQYCYITPTVRPPTKIQFMGSDNSTVVGELAIVDDELRFTGNADEAAKVFFDNVLKRVCDEYIINTLAQKIDTEPSAALKASMDELESGGGQRFETVEEALYWLNDEGGA